MIFDLALHLMCKHAGLYLLEDIHVGMLMTIPVFNLLTLVTPEARVFVALACSGVTCQITS